MALNRAERRRAERDMRKSAAKVDPDALFAEALAHHDDGQINEALKLAQQVLDIDKEHSHALLLAGMAAIQSGDTDKALGFLADKTRLDPDNPHGHLNHGAAVLLAGDMEQAVACFRRSITLDPEMEDTLCQVLEETAALALREIERAYVDNGYVGHNAPKPCRVFRSGQKRSVQGRIKREQAAFGDRAGHRSLQA